MVKIRVENESKREKFKRIATLRANRVLDDIRLLGNCSNTSTYKFSEDDIRIIFTAIESEIKRVKIMFEKKRRRKIEL